MASRLRRAWNARQACERTPAAESAQRRRQRAAAHTPPSAAETR
jgi:hypothetical protein